MKRSRILLVLALLPFAALRIATGCSAQAEGELCDLNNNNDDCQVNLVCTMKTGYSACCPPTGSTNPACEGTGLGTTTSTGTGAGGTGGTGGTSGTGGASATDGGSDASDGSMSSDASDGGMSSDAADASD